MTDTHLGRRLLIGWVRLVRRSASLVLALAVLLTSAAAYVTVTGLGINTNTTDMLSEELPFRQHDRALAEAFPQFGDNLIVVVEAATPDLAEDAAARLAMELHARPETFPDVFYPEGERFFRRNGLLYLELEELEALADRLAEAQPLLSALAQDPSLRGLSNVLGLALTGSEDGGADPGLAAMGPALDRFAAAAERLGASQAGDPQAYPLSWQALLSGETPDLNDRRRLIVLRPALDFASLAPAVRATESLRRLVEDLGLTGERGIRVRLTGEAVMFQDELNSLRDGMGFAGLLSVLLVFGLLILGLRSARLVAATLITLVMGLVWTAGFATLAIGELNLISVAFAVLFIGLSVDFGIHFALRYREAVQRRAASAPDAAPEDPEDALIEAARSVGGPLALCALAAALGFLSFLPTAYRGVSELGLISGVGMFIALFANLTVLPAVLGLLPLKARGPGLGGALGGGIQGLATRRPRGVIGCAVALGLAGAALSPFAAFDDDPLNLRDPGSESVATLGDLLGDARFSPYSAEVLAQDLAAAETLAGRLEALPGVASVRLLSDYLPAAQDDKLAVIDEMAVFLAPVFDSVGTPPPSTEENRRALTALRAHLETAPESLGAGVQRLARALDGLRSGGAELDEGRLADLERVWLGSLPGRLDSLRAALDAEAVTLAGLPEALRARSLSRDGRARVEVVPRDDLRDAAARRRFVDSVRTVAPAAAGVPVIITEAGRAVVQAFGEAAAYAVVLISLLLVVLLRSLWDSMLVLAPLVLAALLTVGVTVLAGIPFNFANVMVLPLLFGLGVASGIHMVTRARGVGVGGLAATSTPRAVLFSALTTIGSFCALALSSHRGTSSMGVLLTIAITLTMLCTLVVLPALLARGSRPAAAAGLPGIRAPGLGRVLTLLLGLGILAAIAGQTDLTEVWRRLLDLGALGAAAVCAVYMAAFLIDTGSWQLMLPSVRLDGGWLYRLWKVRMVGEALNLIIPAGTLGGEPVKAVLLKRVHGIGYREGAASLVIAKTVNLLALILFCAVGLLFMIAEEALPRAFVLAAGLGLAALALGIAGFYATQRWGAAGRLARRLVTCRAGGRWGRRLDGMLEHIREVEDHFERFYARQPGRFSAALALALLNWMVGMAEVAVIMWVLGDPVTLAEAWLIETVAQLVRAGFFFIPASLGASEAAMVLVFGALFGSPPLGFAVALVRRARELLWIAWGLWLGWLEAPGVLANRDRRDEGGDAGPA